VNAILEETSEELNADNNPAINPQNFGRGTKYRAEGKTKATIATRETIRLSAEEWETIKTTVNHGGVIPPD
jgi:hypothetical protein